MDSQYQNQNKSNNSADAPQPYGSDMQDSGTTDRFTQRQQQGQEQWATDSGGGMSGGQQYERSKTGPSTDVSDVQRSDLPTTYRVDDQSEPLSGAASGATGGGGYTEASTEQTQQGSQRQSAGTGAQYGQYESKSESGTQVGGDGTGQTAAGGGSMATSGTEGTTSSGSGLKNIVTGVQGVGEALRGKVMQGVDEVFKNEAGVEKNREIAEAGMEKMRAAKVGHRTAASGGGGEGNTAQTGGTGLRETRY